MNPGSPKIALLETGGSHDEILFSQMRFLKDSGYRIYLIIRSEHLARIGKYDEANDIFSIRNEESMYGRLKNILNIRRYLLRNKIETLLINTCQGAFIRDLSFFLPYRLNITGITHNPQKMSRSLNQKIISRRVKKYFVLSDYILKNITQQNPELQLESFYPIFFRESGESRNHKNFVVTIPGAVDFKRRDYDHLLNELDIGEPEPGIRFIFLGRLKSPEAIEFREKVLQEYPGIQFDFFDEFIPENEFISRIVKSDLVLPLITPGMVNYNLYRDFKITGGINLALGYRIPLLIHENLADNPDYQLAAFFYKEGNLIDTLRHLSGHPEKLKAKSDDIESAERIGYTHQRDQYISFVQKD